MAANILARQFRIQFSDYYSVDISPDTHIVRVLKRTGIVSKDANKNMIIFKARELNPEFPGIIDEIKKLEDEIDKLEGEKEKAVVGSRSEVIASNKKFDIEINPRYAKAYNDIAAAYGKIGEFEKVEENLKKAIKLDRDYADAHYNLGILYDFLGEKEKAMKEFEAAFKLEPRNELYGKKASRK